mgnify:CR=1 FL=1
MTSVQSEIMDELEKIIIGHTKQFLTALDLKIEITESMARALVSKIGVRIAFSESLGKERVNEILWKGILTEK